jgi:hypothetical protein
VVPRFESAPLHLLKFEGVCILQLMQWTPTDSLIVQLRDFIIGLVGIVGRDGLPDWMKSEQRRETPGRREFRRVIVTILLMLTGALVVLSAYAREEHPPAFHLPIMAASAVFLASVGLSRIPFSAKSGGAFVLLAVPVNILVLASATGDNNTSVWIAFSSTLLCTGLTGLLLLSRTDKPVSKATKISVTGFLLEMIFVGPLLYLAGFETDLLMVSLPMMLLTLTAFLVFSAYHWSDTTLPSDKWV